MLIKMVLTLSVVALVLPASASARPPMRSCGDTTASGGLLIGDVTARRVACKAARKVARAVPARCGEHGTCSVRGFTCFTARAREELRFARCSRARGNDELYETIRFDFGS
jgi:hypothetical protein